MNEEQYKLKVLALRESLSEKEERIADLRVEVTVLTNRVKQLETDNSNLQGELEAFRDVAQAQEPTDESD